MLQEMLEHCNQNNIEEEDAFQNHTLYFELCEVKKYWDVSWGSKEKYIFCSARKLKNAPVDIFVPLPLKKRFNLELIETLQAVFKTKTITLVIQHPDSTSLHYEIAKGLPDTTLEVAKPDLSIPDGYIRNHKKYLYTQALNKR